MSSIYIDGVAPKRVYRKKYVRIWCGRVDWMDGIAQVWDTRKEVCTRRTNKLARKNEGTVQSIEQVTIPIDRKGLTAWLDRNYNTDNG